MRAFQSGEAAVLRNPSASRPWQHVLEPLGGYLLAVERIFAAPASGPAAWNFGPPPAATRRVAEVAAAAARAWGGGAHWVARPDADSLPEAAHLSLDSRRAQAELGWEPRWTFEETISRTVRWYRDHHAGGDARRLCRHQIELYSATAPALAVRPAPPPLRPAALAGALAGHA